MSKYKHPQMAELASDLSAGLLRLRRGYVDSAEQLVQLVDLEREYPYEFVVFRLTGIRNAADADKAHLSVLGKALRHDLLKMMLDLCDSFQLRTSDYSDKVYDTKTLARKFRVSTKTIQRWRRRGLPARRLVFPDGKRRVAFLESSVAWFVRQREGQVERSSRFSQLTDDERADIIDKAREMASAEEVSLSDVSRQLAEQTGRAVETIRYTIRKHDEEHPSEAVFPYLSGPLRMEDKENIYRRFLRGSTVQTLAKRNNRTRGSIYRIINEMRARQLLSREIGFVYNPSFEEPEAEKEILGENGQNAPRVQLLRRGQLETKPPRGSADLPAYFKALYDVPLMKPDEERNLFRLYNFLKYQADRLRSQIDVNRVKTSQLKRVESLLLQANAVKNQLIRANLRLVVSIAKKHVGGPQTLFELISDGNLSLMRAVEKFDYARGYRFSTYASWAIMRNFARSVPKERYQLDRFATGHDEVLDIAAGLKTYDPNEMNVPELRESIDHVLNQLTPRERTILIDHYGLDTTGDAKTFDQLGQRLGISKERVRQIEIKALDKLRKMLKPQKADLMS